MAGGWIGEVEKPGFLSPDTMSLATRGWEDVVDLDVQPGESIFLPCTRCASVSLPLVVQEGTTEQQCPTCGRRTRFIISQDQAGKWGIKRESL